MNSYYCFSNEVIVVSFSLLQVNRWLVIPAPQYYGSFLSHDLFNLLTKYLIFDFFNLYLIILDLVVKLGPLTKDGKYAYSIVTSPFKSMLYVLARDPQTFRMKYMNEVFDYLNKNGFTYFFNKPRETYQESDCLYPK